MTGAGRAEIEFENASTLYLGENSVLTLNDLHTTGGVPYTEVALLTGTVSLHVIPYVGGEVFKLKTPTDDLITRYPHQNNFRVTSYIDGMAVTPQLDSFLARPDVVFGDDPVFEPQAIGKGQTEFYRAGERIASAGANDKNTYAEWDQWVADRIAQRTAAMSEVMKASGLTSPIPGLAELKGQGTFFDCAPYGTCWEPAANHDLEQPGSEEPKSERSSAGPSQQPAQSMQTAPSARIQVEEYEDFFPCTPAAIR